MKKVVVIGGGTGSFNILSGLKNYPLQITSVVSMMDSGGSTGILRDEFGILPPGDLRKCLVALSDSPVLRELFQYRYSKGKGLKGHSFGNLFLMTLKNIVGSDEEAILITSKILRVNGRVLPVTLSNCHLGALLKSGKKVYRQTSVEKKPVDKIFLTKRAEIFPPVRKALREADLIVLGPGDLYTSILPNLLVDGVSQSVRKAKAKKVFVCNIMTKGETKGFTAKEYVDEIGKYLGKEPDIILMNSKKPPRRVLNRYRKEGSEFVIPNYLGIKKDLLKRTDYARHDPKRLAKAIYTLAKKQ